MCTHARIQIESQKTVNSNPWTSCRERERKTQGEKDERNETKRAKLAIIVAVAESFVKSNDPSKVKGIISPPNN